jgi:SnoaL-like domain
VDDPQALKISAANPMTPRQVVEEWVRRFNAADADAIAKLYREDATNHQVVQECHSRMFRREFASAKMTCIPEMIHETGNVAILEWKDPLELRGCGVFRVDDDRIALQRGYWDKLSLLRKYSADWMTSLVNNAHFQVPSGRQALDRL